VNQSVSDGSILDESGVTCAEEVAGAINSVFCLPIQSMEVVLENTTTLRLAGCTIRYCTDGSELSVDCMGGIWMDDTPLFKNNRLVLDMVTSELILDSLQQEDQFYDAESSTTSQEEDHPDFRLDLSLEMFEKLDRYSSHFSAVYESLGSSSSRKGNRRVSAIFTRVFDPLGHESEWVGCLSIYWKRESLGRSIGQSSCDHARRGS
jgi:hypothetical protein